MKYRRIIQITVVLLCMGFPLVCLSDDLDAGAEKLKGSFKGFIKNKFLFATEDGKIIKKDRGMVRSLTTEKPVEVLLGRSGKKGEEKVFLVSYEKLKFIIEKDGKKSDVMANTITHMNIPFEDEVEGGGGEIMNIDLAVLDNMDSPTPEQTAAITKYKTVRSVFDKFQEESTRLGKMADKAAEKDRMDLLNDLRMRKIEEQPLKRQIEAAQAALLSAIPQLKNGQPIPQKSTEKKEEPPVAEKAFNALAVAAEPEKQVVKDDKLALIDVSGLEGQKLTEQQSAAVKRYKTAKKNYEDLSASENALAGKISKAKPEDRKKLQDELSKLEATDAEVMKELKDANSQFMKAFPDIKMVSE